MSTPLLVADSGPLIALSRLNLLHLPGNYFESTFVTPVVWDEVTRNPQPVEMDRLQVALASGRIKVVDEVSIPPESLQGVGIDAGEQSAIALAVTLLATLLIDERRGRGAAHAVGVTTIGTLGLLVRARLDALIPPLQPQLNFLCDTGYYLSPRLIEQVLSEVGE